MIAETVWLLLAGILVGKVGLANLSLRPQPLTFSQYTIWGF
jgi:hypothetical protein